MKTCWPNGRQVFILSPHVQLGVPLAADYRATVVPKTGSLRKSWYSDHQIKLARHAAMNDASRSTFRTPKRKRATENPPLVS
jgi:hypothetical protein